MKLNTVKGDFSKLESLIKKLETKKYVDVGILGGASYEAGATIAGIGAVHEYGSISGNIPERSFIRMPLETKGKEINKKLAPKFQKLIEKQDIDKLLTLIGIECEGVIQAAFDTGGYGTWQPILEKTAERKGGSHAILIDDGTLRKSITSRVGGK